MVVVVERSELRVLWHKEHTSHLRLRANHSTTDPYRNCSRALNFFLVDLFRTWLTCNLRYVFLSFEFTKEIKSKPDIFKLNTNNPNV